MTTLRSVIEFWNHQATTGGLTPNVMPISSTSGRVRTGPETMSMYPLLYPEESTTAVVVRWVLPMKRDLSWSMRCHERPTAIQMMTIQVLTCLSSIRDPSMNRISVNARPMLPQHPFQPSKGFSSCMQFVHSVCFVLKHRHDTYSALALGVEDQSNNQPVVPLSISLNNKIYRILTRRAPTPRQKSESTPCRQKSWTAACTL
jgi:hypothetical protein